jgi:peptidoglycan/xylan/chitin deacetylase (PgdA/CDA1 family)
MKQSASKGTFAISLDFELHWGGFEKWPLEKYRQYFLNTREIIPHMLELFKEYHVHVTWATVGMLMHHSREQLLANAPALKPGYTKPTLSAYQYIQTKGIGLNEHEDPFHFAPSLVKKILDTPYQELGTHTFAHYYCNEEGQTLDQFREDIRAAQRVAKSYGQSLKSLVFPRNQFNDQYLKVCFDEGITSVRSNPSDWFWHIQSTQNESAWKRLNRGLDAYFPVGKNNTFKLSSLEVREGYPLCLPASRLLRPYNPKEFFLNKMKITRIESEMARAAQQGEVYHLWWHPHNFGSYPTQSLEGLQRILKHYAYCRDKWSMNSMTMDELTSLRINENATKAS